MVAGFSASRRHLPMGLTNPSDSARRADVSGGQERAALAAGNRQHPPEGFRTKYAQRAIFLFNTFSPAI